MVPIVPGFKRSSGSGDDWNFWNEWNVWNYNLLSGSPEYFSIAIADRLVSFSYIENVGHAHVLTF